MRLKQIAGNFTKLLIVSGLAAVQAASPSLDDQLVTKLQQVGFSGKIESTLPARLHRSIDPKLANLGRLLFFDKIGALHSDNGCGGCHAPSAAFGDTQSIAIGIQNNNIAGK